MVVREACPVCAFQHCKKNGPMHTGKQNYRCKQCGRQFVVHAEHRVIDEDQRTLGERLLREKISLHGICRAVGVSMRWRMDFMGSCFQAAPTHLPVQPVGRPREVAWRRLEAEADDRCSVGQKKANKQWVGRAMDRTTRQIIACHVGDRGRERARELWATIPEAYRERAMFYTDQ